MNGLTPQSSVPCEQPTPFFLSASELWAWPSGKRPPLTKSTRTPSNTTLARTSMMDNRTTFMVRYIGFGSAKIIKLGVFFLHMNYIL